MATSVHQTLPLDFAHILVVILGYILALSTSGLIVRLAIGARTRQSQGQDDNDAQAEINLGRIIGKCENILTITFILAGEVTSLALIFAAKSIIRKDDIAHDPRFYLGGTLVNFCYSVVIGFILRLILSVI